MAGLGTDVTLLITFLAFRDGLCFRELGVNLPDLIDFGLGFAECISKLGIRLSLVCFENGCFSLGISSLSLLV